MILSVLVALILTPALCAIMLKPSHDGVIARWLGWFERGLTRTTDRYGGLLRALIVRPLIMLAAFAAIVAEAYSIFTQLSGSFLPEEDQGVLMTQISLPNGANAARTQAMIDLVETYFLTQEKDAVERSAC